MSKIRISDNIRTVSRRVAYLRRLYARCMALEALAADEQSKRNFKQASDHLKVAVVSIINGHTWDGYKSKP